MTIFDLEEVLMTYGLDVRVIFSNRSVFLMKLIISSLMRELLLS